MRRYLSVWLRRLSTDRIERRLSAPADGPRVVVASIKSAQRIVALNDAAARLGLKPGMALADARAMYPALPVADADAEADRRLLEAIADWCDRYTPLVGLDPPDGLVLDITGCAHLFGGEAALARDLVMRLARQGFARACRGRRHRRLRLGRGAVWRFRGAGYCALSPCRRGQLGSSTQRMGEGSGCSPHPIQFVERSAQPSPGKRAFTPVFDGLWGEGTRCRR